MNVLIITIPISLLLVAFFVGAYIYAVRRNQFTDLVTPAHRMLLDDDEGPDATERRTDNHVAD
jgi:cbb3-type cytochrome oxidase maturation protein